MKLNNLSEEEKRLVFNWIWQSALFLVMVTPAFFLISGDWPWTWGWVFITSLWLFMAAQPAFLIPINPGLLAERARGMRAEGIKRWDQTLVRLASIAWFAAWLLSAFDHRYKWTGEYNNFIHLTGASGTALGFAIFVWAMVANAFFSEGVRIQVERGHQVCDSGPYRFVRHPGYAGNILAILSIPLLLGSLSAFIPALLCALFFLIRTAKEDQTLREELDGYVAYTNKTRFRIFPGIW
ncbi:MAG TPA: isoprenylcysteine carboxylmethyltransferase family protein [Pelolinea sp.]|nr:isoprenylcysteine carboxylmethyltransferase family protein [Pelolinea sp.]